MKRSGPEETLRCSFCHKTQEVVGKLISTPGQGALASRIEGVVSPGWIGVGAVSPPRAGDLFWAYSALPYLGFGGASLLCNHPVSSADPVDHPPHPHSLSHPQGGQGTPPPDTTAIERRALGAGPPMSRVPGGPVVSGRGGATGAWRRARTGSTVKGHKALRAMAIGGALPIKG